MEKQTTKKSKQTGGEKKVQFGSRENGQVNESLASLKDEIVFLRAELELSKQHSEAEKSMLLSLSKDITSSRSKEAILDIVNNKLSKIFEYNAFTVSLVASNNINHGAYLYSLPDEMLNHPELEKRAAEKYIIKDGVYEHVLDAKGPVIFDMDELMDQENVPGYVDFFYKNGIREMVAFPLRINRKSIGGVFIHSKIKNAFTKEQLSIADAVCCHIAIAVANINAYETISKSENEKSLLISLSRDITSCQTEEDVQRILSTKLVKYFQDTDIMVCLNNSDNITHQAFIYNVSKETINHPDFASGSTMKYFINDGIFNVIEDSDQPVTFDIDELVTRTSKPFYVDFWHSLKVEEIIGFPIRMNNKCIGAATVYPRVKNAFSESQLKLAQAICSYLGITLENIRSYKNILSQLEFVDRYKSQLEQENLYLQEQIKTSYNNAEVVGSNNGLKKIFQLVSNVALSDSTVLLLGETGTGKELIATTIHNASPRKGRVMIKVNCAALPAHLIESELFGHERGSFTGATERRIGKFELANNSTIFLDEIGEMPLDLQVKLLRVIQEKEIERIGGAGTIKTNVRIIAATNRNLLKEVESGKFRTDLFYRLNVFPITIPPLRERIEDLPMLVSHFIKKFSSKAGRTITNVAPGVINEMTRYEWPGNIRELEHVIERSVLMTTGKTITDIYLTKNDKVQLLSAKQEVYEVKLKSLKQQEREHILAALKKSNGRVRGPGGAAEILELPPTTLHSKMKKLGIKKIMS